MSSPTYLIVRAVIYSGADSYYRFPKFAPNYMNSDDRQRVYPEKLFYDLSLVEAELTALHRESVARYNPIMLRECIAMLFPADNLFAAPLSPEQLGISVPAFNEYQEEFFVTEEQYRWWEQSSPTWDQQQLESIWVYFLGKVSFYRIETLLPEQFVDGVQAQ
ncbi:MAG: hypothetical protein R3B84_10260 [Zavarzinella sp.]